MKIRLLATLCGVLMLASTAARADYLFELNWYGTYVLDTCFCEDPINGGVGGDIQIRTASIAGKYEGNDQGLDYVITIVPDADVMQGATASVTGSFSDAYTDWILGASSNDAGGGGAIGMVSNAFGVDGLGYGSAYLSPALYAVPEPSILALLLAGISLLIWRQRMSAAADAPQRPGPSR